jgi:hypothetical protein
MEHHIIDRNSGTPAVPAKRAELLFTIASGDMRTQAICGRFHGVYLA